MIDIKLIRTEPDKVRENIKKKFQDEKLPLVDEVIELDAEYRAARTRCDELRNRRNVLSKQIGGMMARGEREAAEAAKAEVKAMAGEMEALAAREAACEAEIRLWDRLQD